MNKEFEFLNIIEKKLSNSSYLGNDCAYLDEYNIAISQDSLIEDVHFSLKYSTPYEIAKKALLVNISDILASGAKVQYATIALSGKLNSEFVEQFYQGIKEISEQFDVKIIGGDLTRSEKITISISVIGNWEKRNISKRNNAKDGYIVAVAGEFGSSAQGLIDLKNGIKDNYFIQKHKFPKLFSDVSEKISFLTKNPYAMMDSSDGLFDCLWQISSKSNVKIDINYNLVPKKIEDKNLVLFGGEDYSLVVCLNEKDFINIPELIKIGKVEKGCGVFVDGEKINYKGYEHFE